MYQRTRYRPEISGSYWSDCLNWISLRYHFGALELSGTWAINTTFLRERAILLYNFSSGVGLVLESVGLGNSQNGLWALGCLGGDSHCPVRWTYFMSGSHVMRVVSRGCGGEMDDGGDGDRRCFLWSSGLVSVIRGRVGGRRSCPIAGLRTEVGVGASTKFGWGGSFNLRGPELSDEFVYHPVSRAEHYLGYHLVYPYYRSLVCFDYYHHSGYHHHHHHQPCLIIIVVVCIVVLEQVDIRP